MIVYRIAKKKNRSNDISGQGAANEGGRWNSKGVHALYTSESRALALLEVMVHVDLEDLPNNLYIMQIEIGDESAMHTIADSTLPDNWREVDNLQLRSIGDQLIHESQYLAFKVRSAVLPSEYNIIINPNHPEFNERVKVMNVEELIVDSRL